MVVQDKCMGGFGIRTLKVHSQCLLNEMVVEIQQGGKESLEKGYIIKVQRTKTLVYRHMHASYGFGLSKHIYAACGLCLWTIQD